MRFPKKTNGWLDEFKDLKQSYRGTYWMLRNYLKRLEKQTKDADGNEIELENGDIKIVKKAISDVNLAIQWMHTGRRPGNKRGIERRAAYQREKLMDPILMQSFVQRSTAGSPANLSDWDRFRIEAALHKLTDKERQCFEMSHGMGYSLDYIAESMGIAKGTAQKYVSRAQEKVTHELRTNLFIV